MPARVSVLTILQPTIADAGLYTCKIDAKTSATVEIIASGFGKALTKTQSLISSLIDTAV